MIQRNMGEEVWRQVEGQLKEVARSILYLEYDEKDSGSVE
jgi:hypothetical protein